MVIGEKGKEQAENVQLVKKAEGKSHLYIGTVKSFNQYKGWGFIDCPAVQAKYQKDAFLIASQIGSFPFTVSEGDSVSFQCTESEKGPQATSVRPLGNAGMKGS